MFALGFWENPKNFCCFQHQGTPETRLLGRQHPTLQLQFLKGILQGRGERLGFENPRAAKYKVRGSGDRLLWDVTFKTALFEVKIKKKAV